MEDCAYARGLLAAAVRHMRSERSLHEGLFKACNNSLQWLDVDRYRPSVAAADYRQWRAGLLPDSDGEDVRDYLLAAVRRLDLRAAREKERSLQRIAAMLQTTAAPGGGHCRPA